MCNITRFNQIKISIGYRYSINVEDLNFTFQREINEDLMASILINNNEHVVSKRQIYK